MANWFESRAETMTETEAKAYFTESSYPHPGLGEAWGEAIKRAYLVDVNRAAEMIPRLGGGLLPRSSRASTLPLRSSRPHMTTASSILRAAVSRSRREP